MQSVHLIPIGETSAPRQTAIPAPVRMLDPLLSNNVRNLAKGTWGINSVTTAEADIRARAEQVRQLAQAPVSDARRRERMTLR